jgi:PAS domain S-box-containing protein
MTVAVKAEENGDERTPAGSETGLASPPSLGTPGEDLFYSIFEHAAVGMEQVALDGRLLHVNAALCRMLGYSRTELLLKTSEQITHPADRDCEAALLHSTLRGERDSYEIEKRYLHRNGSPIWANLTSSLVKDAAGQALYRVLIVQDITARKQAEQARSESENAFITLANFVPQFVWMCLPDGMNIYFNQRWVDYTGLTLEQSYGRGWNTPFHPDDKQPAWGAWNHAVETGEQYCVESRLRAADGSYRWFLMRGEPMRLASAGVARWFGTCTDIDDLRRQSEGRFRSVLDSSRDVIYRFNLQTGRYEYISPSAEAVSGYTAGELEALDLETTLAMVHPDDRAALQASLVRLQQTGEGQAEYRQRNKNGQYRWLSNRMSLARDSAGRPQYRDGNIRDITERKQAEEALRAREQEFRVLAHNLVSAVALIDARGELSIVNKSFLRMFDLDEHSTLLNVNSRDWSQWRVFDESGRLLEVDEHPVRQAVLTRTAVRDKLIAMQSPSRATPKWLLVSAEPILDAQGDIQQVICTYHDITEQKLAEQALREEKATLQAILDATDESIWLIGADGTLISGNATALKRVPRPAEQILGKHMRETIDPKLAASRAACVRRVVETGQPMETEDEREGMVFRHHYYPVRDRSGRIDRVVAYSRDITERKKIEETLQRYRLLARQARDIVLFIRLEDGLILEANAAAVEAYGYTIEQLKRMTIHDLRDAATRPLTPGEMAEADTQGILFESIHQRADGTTFPVEVSSQGATIGGTRTLVSIVRDITQRKRAEEALQASQDRMAAIIGSAMDAVITIGADRRILVFNAAAEGVFRCPAAEAIGCLLDRFIPLMFREAHRAHVEEFAGSGATSRSMQSPGVLLGLRANGEEFPLEATISQVTVSGEKLYTVILRDLTQRVQTEQALIRSEKLASVGRMAATIAHEINNPLEAVTNLLFLVAGMENLPVSARHLVDMADAELSRIAHITRQSLGFYREFSAPAPTSVDEVLQSAISLLRNKIASKQAVIVGQWDKNLHITAIAGELRQVFTNLMANSLDAIADKGTITLRVSARAASCKGNSSVRFTIADNGSGIDAAAQRNIFEPFFTTKGAVGTGLGLWVSKQIVEKHGGAIRLRSSTDQKHRGTAFSIVLPVAYPPQTTPAPAP